MNKTISYLYFVGALVMPTAYALASGNEADGHGHQAVAVADPSSRKYVIIAVAVVFSLMIAWFIWSKIKSKAPMG